MARVYRNPVIPSANIPQVDLLTLLFDSEHTACKDENKVLHVDTANPSNQITKSDLRNLTKRIAHGLRSFYEIGANGRNRDVVTTISYGQLLSPAVYFGIVAAGGISAAASPSSTAVELIRQLKETQSKLIVCGKEHELVACKAAKECGIAMERVLVAESTPILSLKSVKGKREAISSQCLEWHRITDLRELKESLITILWSSGTTGLPKGVMLSHHNLVAETYITVLSARDWAIKAIAEDAFKAVEYRALAHLPLSHIAGLFGCMITPFYNNGTVFWMPQYNWKHFIQNMKRFKITMLFTMPTVYLRISKSPEATGIFQSLVSAAAGGSPMDGMLQAATNPKLGNGRDVFVGQTWGLSESTGGCTGPLIGIPDVTGCIGSPLPSVEIRIVDDDFKDVEPGQHGELLIRSPTVMRGYLNDIESTERTMHDDWLCTGDIGVFKDEKMYIVDRKKELLKFKGLQIAPAELENLLVSHPRVEEAAVIGVPSPDDPSSDLPRAYVVANTAEVSEQELMEFVKQKAASYKQLRGGLVFTTAIPKNGMGKYLRKDLRERAMKEMRATRERL
ncbi:hypothetical protein HYFRA_00006596 [Hymenoscyphus fraxineus]|uniref:4-coumarate-CoA ligase n=1 Tax=Hymenoscyphus fraxineus TaxID=746836 RepID=A0A9N9PTP0_9HELO|nr:hypothetical protein HYFRA_00006596 [Hymenoscyphus fraxineus]